MLRPLRATDDRPTTRRRQSATGGYVAFNLAHINATGPYTAAYNIVMSLDGSDVQINPTFRADTGQKIHFCGFKVSGSSTVAPTIIYEFVSSRGRGAAHWDRSMVSPVATKWRNGDRVEMTRDTASSSSSQKKLRHRRRTNAPLTFCCARRHHRRQLRDPDHFIMAADNNTSEEGPAFVWNWKTDEYYELAGGMASRRRRRRRRRLRRRRRRRRCRRRRRRRRLISSSRTVIRKMPRPDLAVTRVGASGQSSVKESRARREPGAATPRARRRLTTTVARSPLPRSVVGSLADAQLPRHPVVARLPGDGRRVLDARHGRGQGASLLCVARHRSLLRDASPVTGGGAHIEDSRCLFFVSVTPA